MLGHWSQSYGSTYPAQLSIVIVWVACNEEIKSILQPAAYGAFSVGEWTATCLRKTWCSATLSRGSLERQGETHFLRKVTYIRNVQHEKPHYFLKRAYCTMYDDTSVQPNCNKEFHGSETYAYIQHMCEPRTHSGHSQQGWQERGNAWQDREKAVNPCFNVHVVTAAYMWKEQLLKMHLMSQWHNQIDSWIVWGSFMWTQQKQWETDAASQEDTTMKSRAITTMHSVQRCTKQEHNRNPPLVPVPEGFPHWRQSTRCTATRRRWK